MLKFLGGRKESGEEMKYIALYHLSTNTGERTNNEDNVGMYQNGDEYCFALADGLGGHGKGELASQIAVETAVRLFAAEGAAEGILEASFAEAQKAILEGQKEDFTAMDMKTTLVVLHVKEDEVRWGHIGDSRLYYFQNGKLVSRTLDHSVPQMLVAAGQIRESQIRHHADRNRLLRVLGVDWDEPKYQIAEPVKRQGSQQFLMCSDGFWELIDEKRMANCLKKSSSPQEWVALMEEIIQKNGKGTNMDNYSAVAVWLQK